ncbi:MAG: heavy metal translocating P-type ATPase, partial [Microbacteriaceae bacterium]|nr:heavy metal translocating P-type ATPase [Microbacteriaceae bacterium]
MNVLSLVRRYPLVGIALLVALAGWGLESAPWEFAAQVAVSSFALIIATIKAWSMARELLAGHVGLDVLAVTAIVATVAVSEYWASLVIVLMLTGGEALEDYAEGRAERELSSILEHVPQVAHRLGPDGSIEDIPVDMVAVGDRLVVRPSEVVPVDATLVSEGASFDESSLTGESLPSNKVAGDAVMSGAINGSGAIHIDATTIAADSQFQRIVELVREAKGSK